MTQFKVTALMTTPLELIVTADTAEQAWQIALDADGGEFTPLPDSEGASWDLVAIEGVAE